jgi:ribonuclease HI
MSSPISSPNTEIFFTDGSGRKAGSSGYACIRVLPSFEGWQVRCNNETNIQMEGKAILHAIISSSSQSKKIIIVRDSEFWIKMLTLYIPSRLAKNKSIDTFKNPDLCEHLYSEYQKKKDKIVFRHVRAHNSKPSKNKMEEFDRVWNNVVDYFTNHFPPNTPFHQLIPISLEQCKKVFNGNSNTTTTPRI